MILEGRLANRPSARSGRFVPILCPSAYSLFDPFSFHILLNRLRLPP